MAARPAAVLRARRAGGGGPADLVRLHRDPERPRVRGRGRVRQDGELQHGHAAHPRHRARAGAGGALAREGDAELGGVDARPAEPQHHPARIHRPQGARRQPEPHQRRPRAAARRRRPRPHGARTRACSTRVWQAQGMRPLARRRAQGVLPPGLFTNGHTFFVQEVAKRPQPPDSEPPYSLHLTYQVPHPLAPPGVPQHSYPPMRAARGAGRRRAVRGPLAVRVRQTAAAAAGGAVALRGARLLPRPLPHRRRRRRAARGCSASAAMWSGPASTRCRWATTSRS